MTNTDTADLKLGDKYLSINLTTVLRDRKVTLADLDKAAAAAASAVRATLEGTRSPYTVDPIRVTRSYGYFPWQTESKG